MVSESARYYQTHPLARKRKAMYDRTFEIVNNIYLIEDGIK